MNDIGTVEDALSWISQQTWRSIPAYRGNSVASSSELIPITATSAISGCCNSTLSSSAGGTDDSHVVSTSRLASGAQDIYLGSPIRDFVSGNSCEHEVRWTLTLYLMSSLRLSTIA